MGTSLSGLTPATTFDGLLKVGDNDPLTSTLKAISTGDGTDTILQLSTTALQVGGATGMHWDNTNKRLGLNDVSPTSRIDIKNTFGASSLSQLDRMGMFIGYTSASFGLALGGTSSYTSGLVQGTNNLGNASGPLSLNPFGGNVGVGAVSAAANLHIKGSGATSATTSLLVQNSAGNTALEVLDNRDVKLNLGAYQFLSTGLVSFLPINVNNELRVGFGTGTTAEARLHVKGSGNDNTTTSLLVQNSDGTELFKVDDSGATDITANITNSFLGSFRNTDSNGFGIELRAGNALSRYSLQWERYNGGGGGRLYPDGVMIGDQVAPAARLQVKGSGATSATKALIVQNSGGETMFSVRDDKTIQMDGSRFTFNSSAFTSYADILLNTDLAVGTTTIAANTRAHIKGSGATSATTALLVQNSAGTDMLKVTDDGVINVRQSLFINHPSVSSRQLRFDWGAISATDNASELTIGAVYSQPTAPRINLGGKTRASGADAIQVQALNGMYIAPTTFSEDPSAQLHIKGSGATSATTALLVQNSAGTDMFSVKDDLSVVFNSTITSASSTLRFDVGGVGTIRMNSDQVAIGGNTTPTARLHIKGTGATSATTALLVQNSAGTDMLKVQDDSSLLMYRASNGVELLKIGESGGNAILYANGNANRSLVLGYENALTAFNQTVFKTYNGTGYSEAMVITGNSNTDQFVGIGQTTPTAKLHIKGNGTGTADYSFKVQNAIGNNNMQIRDDGAVFLTNMRYTFNAAGGAVLKGSGATSATTALLVENSAGTDLLKVEDGGNIVTSGFTFQSNIIKPNINGYIGINHGDNRTFSIIDSNGARTYLNVQSSSTSNFADVSINTDHLVIKKEGNVAVGTSTLDASAKLQVDSTTQGFLPPRMTDSERDAITSPAAGLMVYDTSNNQMNYWNGTTWIAF